MAFSQFQDNTVDCSPPQLADSQLLLNDGSAASAFSTELVGELIFGHDTIHPGVALWTSLARQNVG
jgi:hypothetical protein